MQLRILSDVHTEMWNYSEAKFKRVVERILPVMEGEYAQTLVIAGDAGSMHKTANLKMFLELVAERFGAVLYVPGNHEYYGGSFRDTDLDIGRIADEVPCVTYGRRFREVRRGSDGELFSIHCATLWTDFDAGNPTSMLVAGGAMNDYRQIGGFNPDHNLTPEEVLGRHRAQLEMIEVMLEEGDVVVTHHLPSFESVDERFRDSPVNGAYATELKELILEKKPKLWVHGHTHSSKDYMIGDTRVVCNPVGYPGEHRVGAKFNPEFVIEI